MNTYGSAGLTNSSTEILPPLEAVPLELTQEQEESFSALPVLDESKSLVKEFKHITDEAQFFSVLKEKVLSGQLTLQQIGALQSQVSDLTLSKLVESWLMDSSPLVAQLGFQLYLLMTPILHPCLRDFVFRYLPYFIRYCPYENRPSIFELLEQSVANASPAYRQIIDKLKTYVHVSSLEFHDWTLILIETKDPDLVGEAYKRWKEKEYLIQEPCHASMGWKLFEALHAYPAFALSVFRTLKQHKLLTSEQEFKGIVRLILAYQAHAPLQIHAELDRCFISFIDSLLRAKTTYFHQDLMKALAFGIETLYQSAYWRITADYFLLQASRHKYLDATWQTERWLKRLEELSQQTAPESTLFLSLCKIAFKEKFLTVSPQTQERIQRLQIREGELLLKQGHVYSSVEVLGEVSQGPFEGDLFSLFSTWFLHFFRQKEMNLIIEEHHLGALNTLLLTTSDSKRLDVQPLFYQFFQQVILTIKGMQSSVQRVFPFAFFHQFLGRTEMIPLMEYANKEWQTLLLDYLEAVRPLLSADHFPGIWAVYEQMMRLSHKVKNSLHLLHLFKLLPYLLQHASKPSTRLFEWLKQQHITVLKTLKNNGCFQEVYLFLIQLRCHDIPHALAAVAPYVWGIYEQELAKPIPSVALLVEVLPLKLFDALSAQLPPPVSAQIPRLISCLLTAQPPQPAHAWKWLKWSLDQIPQGEPANEEWIENCLTCATQLMQENHPHQALQVLTSLPPLEDSQSEQVQALWLQIALHSASTVNTTRQVFLHPHALALCQRIPEWQGLARKALGRHLFAIQTSHAEKTLALDLLSRYFTQESKVWLAFWRHLDPRQAEDAALVAKAWECFKTQWPHLTGSQAERADCWTLALTCLQVAKPKHPDILSYFHNRTWIENTYSDPSLIHFKRKAIRAVYLGVVSHLSPTAFDIALYGQLYDSKHQFIESALSLEDETITLVVNQFDEEIELALIEQLKSSSHMACIRAVGVLLTHHSKRLIKRLPPEQPLAVPTYLLTISTHLSDVEQVIKSYLALKLEEDPDDEKAALPAIRATIEAACCLPNEATSRLLNKKTCRLPKISLSSHLSLLTAFTNTGFLHFRPLEVSLFLKVLQEGSHLECQQLKPFIEILMPTCIQACQKLESFQQIETSLTRAFSLIGLKLSQKCQFSHLLLNTFLEHACQEEPPEGITVEATVACYQRWAPYIFAQSASLQMALEQIVAFTFPQPTEGTAALEPMNQAQFNLYLASLLDVKYRAQSLKESKYHACLNSYHENVLQAIKKRNPSQGLFVEAFYHYIVSKLEATQDKLDPRTIHGLLEAFIDLFPPEEATWDRAAIKKEEEDKDFKIRSHHAYATRLIRQAYARGIFKNYSDKLVSLEFWLDITVTGKKRKIEIQQLTFIIDVVERFLKHQTPYSLYSAIQMIGLLHGSCLVHQKYDDLRKVYSKVLQALHSHMQDTVDKELLLFHLYQNTLTRPPENFTYHANDTGPALVFSHQHTARQQHLNKNAEFYTQTAIFFFNHAQKHLQALSKQPDTIQLQAYYLNLCFIFLTYQVRAGVFERDYSAYLRILQGFISTIHHLEVSQGDQLLLKSNFNHPSFGKLTQEWLKFVLAEHIWIKDQLPMKLKARDRAFQRQVLFEWLSHLNKLHLKQQSERERQCATLVSTISTITMYADIRQLLKFSGTQKDAADLFETSQHIVLMQGTPQQKMSITTAEMRFKLDLVKQDYKFYLECLESFVSLVKEVDGKVEELPLSPPDILETFFIPPEDNPSVYFERRQTVFLTLLKDIQPFLSQTTPLTFAVKEEVETFLVKMLEQGADHDFLQGDHPLVVEIFEWIKNWVGHTDYYSTSLQLIELIVYKNTRCTTEEGDVSDYCRKRLGDIIDNLPRYINQTKDFSHSFRLSKLITTLPVSPERQSAYFTKWLMTVKRIRDFQLDKAIVNHHLLELGVKLTQAYGKKGASVDETSANGHAQNDENRTVIVNGDVVT